MEATRPSRGPAQVCSGALVAPHRAASLEAAAMEREARQDIPWAQNRTSDNMGAAQVVGPSPVQVLPRAKHVSHFSCSDGHLLSLSLSLSPPTLPILPSKGNQFNLKVL